MAVLVGLAAQRMRLPLTVVLAVSGIIATQLGLDLALVEVLSGEGFKELLVNLFLPILVFEAALGLSTREFMRNLVAITALATVALLISTAFVGFSLVWALAIPLAGLIGTDPVELVILVAIVSSIGVPRKMMCSLRSRE